MISTPASSERIPRRRLYQEVAARIEALIQKGTYKPGDQLPSERDLMKQFGVGRPAVREALFSLQKMGLVVVSQGDRARVTKPSSEVLLGSLSGAVRQLLSAPDGVRQLQDARLFFEAGLARHAALHATAGDIAALDAALESNRQALGDMAQFERTDVEFHHAIARIARNPIFEAMHQALIGWLTEQRHITLGAPRQQDFAFRAHQQITAAIAAKNADRAERMMRDHLQHVARIYWKQRALEAEATA